MLDEALRSLRPSTKGPSNRSEKSLCSGETNAHERIMSSHCQASDSPNRVGLKFEVGTRNLVDQCLSPPSLTMGCLLSAKKDEGVREQDERTSTASITQHPYCYRRVTAPRHIVPQKRIRQESNPYAIMNENSKKSVAPLIFINHT